jgi:hypothetical protein
LIRLPDKAAVSKVIFRFCELTRNRFPREKDLSLHVAMEVEVLSFGSRDVLCHPMRALLGQPYLERRTFRAFPQIVSLRRNRAGFPPCNVVLMRPCIHFEYP